MPVLDGDKSPAGNDPFRKAIFEALRAAVSLSDAKYAAAEIDQHPAIATDDHAPAQEAVSIGLIDSRGRARGTLRVKEASPNQLQAIGLQIIRIIELYDSAREWKRELDQIRPLTDQALVAIYSIHNGRFSYVNSKFAEALGYTRDELLALESFDELVVDEERSRVRDMVRQRLDGETRHIRYVTKIRKKDGNIMHAEVHGSVAVVEGGRLVIGTAVDVTAQHEAEKQLRDREEFFRIITESIGDVVLVVNAAGMVTYISGSVENVLGYSVAERWGKRAFETVHPDDVEALRTYLDTFASGDQLDGADFRFLHKNGSVRVLRLCGKNLLQHPAVRGWLFNVADVTDRNRLEEELEQLHRLTSLGRLAAQVAHEFNNVMMGIQTPVDLMRRRAGGDAESVRFIDMISSSISRGKRITSDILRFGRPAELTVRPVQVQDFLRRVFDEVRPLLAQEIDLRLEVPSEPLFVRADPAQLSQVLMNLCLNARDAMQGRAGSLTLGARRGEEHTALSIGDLPNSDHYVHISVTDTGSGISSEDLPYIFEPLYTTKRTGTGLGLSVVFQVIAAHGGHIFVETKYGQGTTFHLFIHRALRESDPDVVPESKGGDTSRPKRRVLVVEDEVAIATGLRWVLEAEGMTVHLVGRAADVSRAMDAFKPDVMLLDLSLPDADGRAVYETVAGRLPVIFSTGSFSERELLESGHERVDVLMKPYTGEELMRAIDRVLGPGRNHE